MAAPCQANAVECQCRCEQGALIEFDSNLVLQDGDDPIQCKCTLCGPEEPLGSGKRRCAITRHRCGWALQLFFEDYPGYCPDCQDCIRTQRLKEAIVRKRAERAGVKEKTMCKERSRSRDRSRSRFI